MTTVQARMIIEILGRPKEHVASALALLVEKLGKEQGISLISSDMHEPIKAKDTADLFTTYAEVFLEAQSLQHLFGLLFTYMPANVEIIKPVELVVKNDFLNTFANTLVQRLQMYEAVTKRLVTDREKAIRALQEKRPELMKAIQKAQTSTKKNNKKKKKN
jgi:hypothetical protein